MGSMRWKGKEGREGKDHWLSIDSRYSLFAPHFPLSPLLILDDCILLVYVTRAYMQCNVVYQSSKTRAVALIRCSSC